jgi:S1-C subfamily serine protease
VAQAEPRPRRYGIRLADLAANPLEVLGVDADSPAARAGLQTGDVILKMNEKSIQVLGREERIQALTQSPLKLQVRRGEKSVDIVMSLDVPRSATAKDK